MKIKKYQLSNGKSYTVTEIADVVNDHDKWMGRDEILERWKGRMAHKAKQ